MNELLKIAINSAVEAGKAILKIYRTGDFSIERKADNSPLTIADKNAHSIIQDHLSETNIPILSEEGVHEGYGKRKRWSKLWIVDPLDGTKEFIKKTGEFTVNIALVEDNYPIAGVVFVPAEGVIYYADKDLGSYKAELNSDWESRETVLLQNEQLLPIVSGSEILSVVASVSHLSKETELFIAMLKKRYGETEFLSVGSSIKICKIAEGSADIYPRLGPTMEWDTAAGQAIAEMAGAKFINWKTKLRFDYNRSDLLNGWFIVAGSKFKEEELQSIIQAFAP